MKKILLVLAVFFALSVPSFALLHVGVNAGYAYANMDHLNNAWEYVKQQTPESYGTAKATDFGNSIFVNADVGLGLLPFLNVGPRTGLQYVFPATFELTADYGMGQINYKETITTMLIPAELGVSANIAIPLTPFSVTAGIYGGYGFAFATREITTNTLSISDITFTQPFNGGGFMADASAALEMNILPFINISLNGGYRYCLIENINSTKEIKDPLTGDVIVSADQMEVFPNNGDKLKVNFSGFQVGAGLNIRF